MRTTSRRRLARSIQQLKADLNRSNSICWALVCQFSGNRSALLVDYNFIVKGIATSVSQPGVDYSHEVIMNTILNAVGFHIKDVNSSVNGSWNV